jgi:putative component of toxin-antitoxin plasmid stabilization module
MTTVYRDWINGLRDHKSTQRRDVQRAIELARNLP